MYWYLLLGYCVLGQVMAYSNKQGLGLQAGVLGEIPASQNEFTRFLLVHGQRRVLHQQSAADFAYMSQVPFLYPPHHPLHTHPLLSPSADWTTPRLMRTGAVSVPDTHAHGPGVHVPSRDPRAAVGPAAQPILHAVRCLCVHRGRAVPSHQQRAAATAAATRSRAAGHGRRDAVGPVSAKRHRNGPKRHRNGPTFMGPYRIRFKV